MAALNSKVRKAVIPVAGLGTRMLPATKAIPKEMLPLVDKPLIQYVVNECIAAGITEIVLVTHSSKNSIENHFDTSFELEAMLEKRVKRQLLEEVQSICPPHVTIMQVRQGLAKGLGHAVMCAHPVVGDEPVAVILPDVILDEYESDLSQDNLAEMIKRFDETGSSQIMVEPVEDVTAYGVVDCKGVNLEPGESVPISDSVSSVSWPAACGSRFHLPFSPQRKPMEPFGTTRFPAISKATVFHSGLLASPSPSTRSEARAYVPAPRDRLPARPAAPASAYRYSGGSS